MLAFLYMSYRSCCGTSHIEAVSYKVVFVQSDLLPSLNPSGCSFSLIEGILSRRYYLGCSLLGKEDSKRV